MRGPEVLVLPLFILFMQIATLSHKIHLYRSNGDGGNCEAASGSATGAPDLVGLALKHAQALRVGDLEPLKWGARQCLWGHMECVWRVAARHAQTEVLHWALMQHQDAGPGQVDLLIPGIELVYVAAAQGGHPCDQVGPKAEDPHRPWRAPSRV